MYAAESLALATLEKIVAVNDVQRLREMVYVPAHLDEEAAWAPSLADLPDGWDQRPPTAASQDFGTDWLDLERSPALQVPSALFPTEAHNYVLNPAHPEFDAAVEVDNAEPLRLDPRIEARPCLLYQSDAAGGEDRGGLSGWVVFLATTSCV